MRKLEKRKIERQIRSSLANFQTREADGAKYIEGYFVRFDSVYTICPGVTESISPNAFDNTINDDIRALIDHETRLVLGRTTVGTLRLSIDDKGLYGVITVNENDSDAMNLYARVQRGDVSQCSFGFIIIAEERQVKDNGDIHYLIKEVRLFEVSVVTFPAYEETSVTARTRDYQKMRIEERKKKLKERLEAKKCLNS